MKVLLVSPPWRMPTQGTLAIAMLRPMLEARGIEVDELHGSMLFPSMGSDVYQLFQGQSRYLFGRALSGRDPADYANSVVRCILAEANAHTVLSEEQSATAVSCELGVDEGELRAVILDNLGKADVCIERAVARGLAGGPYDVIGFSTMFDDQVPASVVLARRFKQAWPGVKIAFGGPACFEEQADGVLAMFPEVDAACHAEGEEVVGPLFEALGGAGQLADVPGIAWRDAAGALHHNPSPPLIRDLDATPEPDYHGFIAQLAESEWRGRGAQLFFETSRGCWWGEKSLCTFCGLNGEGLPFRAKSGERAYEEIRHLYERYPEARSLLATDNILDMRYLKTVFPRLVPLAHDPVRPLKLFYEVKSNMKLDQVQAMADGGVRGVQPGIESFSDGVLRVMRKGCTGLGQIQFIKWATQSGCEPFYNVLVLNPGEEAAWYEEMLEILPFITHLPHPQAIVTMLLERFSPYHKAPDAFGITNVRPKPFYREIFGADVDPRIAYQFDFDHPIFEDEAHLGAVRRLVAAMMRWQANFKPDTALYIDEGDRLVIVDRRDGGETRSTLVGLQARIFLYLDQHRPRTAIGEAFPGLQPELLDALLLTWVHRRWVCRVGDRYLAVLPRSGPARTVAQPKPPRREAVRLQLAAQP